MARIDFLPVCSNCGTTLWGKTINIFKKPALAALHDEKIGWEVVDWDIWPLECPNCRHVFTSIVIPTKLPFETPKKPFY